MSIASERQEVQRLARKYREEGYAVLTDEEAAQVLPDTLRGFVPDLVASKGKEHILVEVRTKGESEDRERIVKLAEAVRQQPNWHLQVHLFEPDRRLSRIAMEPELIETYRRSALQLFESGQTVPALLLMWSVFEAASARAPSRRSGCCSDLGARVAYHGAGISRSNRRRRVRTNARNSRFTKPRSARSTGYRGAGRGF